MSKKIKEMTNPNKTISIYDLTNKIKNNQSN